jgi:prepilin-type N-terminal cleavage/methylation domain-containing protein
MKIRRVYRKRTMKKKTYNKGFTLVEIILTMAILGIVVVAFLDLFTNGTITIFNAGHKSESNVKAQAIVDRIYEETDSKDLGVIKTEIDSILKETIGDGNFTDYTANIVGFNEPYDSNKKTVRYYLTNKTLITNTVTPFLVFRFYYLNGSKTVNISVPLSK